MLRKILTIALVLVLAVAFGCSKKTEQPVAPPPTETEIQKQVEKTGQEVKKEAGAAKEKAGQELEKAGEALQKDANTQ
jgi:hypothetical protein